MLVSQHFNKFVCCNRFALFADFVPHLYLAKN